jgi:hypothetical protein
VGSVGLGSRHLLSQVRVRTPSRKLTVSSSSFILLFWTCASGFKLSRGIILRHNQTLSAASRAVSYCTEGTFLSRCLPVPLLRGFSQQFFHPTNEDALSNLRVARAPGLGANQSEDETNAQSCLITGLAKLRRPVCPKTNSRS